MATSLGDMLDRLPAERRRRVEARAQDLIAREMSLRELRRAMRKTQVQLARKTGKSQVTLSRLERLVRHADPVSPAFAGAGLAWGRSRH